MHSNHQRKIDFIVRERTQRLRSKFSRLSFSIVFGVLMTYLSAFLIQLLVAVFGVSENLEKNIYWEWCISLLPLYLIGVPSIFLIIRNVEAQVPKKQALPLGEFLLLLLIGRFFTLAGTYISSILVSVTEVFLKNPISDSVSDLISKTPVWFIFLTTVILAPIVEEIIYRKLLIDRMCVHGEWIAILFSSLIFSLSHGNLYQVVYAFLNGCILGLLYMRTGKLQYPIVFHMITNFLGSVVALPIVNAQERLQSLLAMGEMGGEYISLSMLVSGYSLTKFALAILGAFVFFFCYKKFLPQKYAIEPIPRDVLFPVLVSTPGFVVFIFVTIFEFILSFL